MAERGEGVAAPTQTQGQNQQNQQQNQQQQQKNQDPSGQQQHLHINWSNFKPELSGKPDEDAEAHLLCSNDWMNAHHFINGVKVQRFQKHTSHKIIWVLFPIEDLRQAVETAKRILKKEKLDKQLPEQTSTSPFMNSRDGTERKVLFSARDEL